MHDDEEARDDRACAAFGVELTDTGDEHGPSDSTAETHDVAVDGSSCFINVMRVNDGAG